MAISKATASCLQSFTECLAVEALMTDEWAENRLADFNLWVSGVGASARGRASLDSRLIARPETRKVIENLLQLLAGVVNDLKGQAVSGPNDSVPDSSNVHGALAPQEPPARPFSPWSTDSESDSQEDNESRLGSTGNPLHEGMQNIEMMLDQLARLGVSIRQSGRRSRLQKADQRFRPGDHKELEQHLSTILLARPGFSKEGIELSKLSEVQQRLIYCNLKRRNRFLYAQQHSKGLDPLSPMDQFTTPVIDMKPTDPQPGLKDHRPGGIKAKRSGGQGDGKTGTSASAVSESFLLDGIPVPAPAASTMMSSTVIDLEYPRPPIVSKDAQLFRCPCCCVALPVFFLETNRWKKHVAEDVSPYSCILPGCSKPYVLYSTKENWRKHLLTEHSSFEYFICFACTDKKQLYSENEFNMHIRIQHASTIPPDRIPLLTPLCKRSAPIKITSCPLCNWPEGEDGEFDKDILLDHIAKEIHAFSLRALPWADNNGQETDERIEYSTKKVHHWLVENKFSVNPSQERPVCETRSYLSEYFEQNAYFGGSSATSNSSEVDTVLSWEVELDNLKEVDGPLSFGSGEHHVSSGEDSDDHEAYSEVDSGRSESSAVDIPYKKGSDDDEPDFDVDSVGPVSWGGDISHGKNSDDEEPNSNIDSVRPGGWGGDIRHAKASDDDEVYSKVDAENISVKNAGNLEQLQKQEEAIQWARRASSQTAVSPNSAAPPAQFVTPQQPAQLEANIQRQQSQNQTRAPISRTIAEKQWNNLPDKIRQMYDEILAQAPPAEPISVQPEQKAQMSQQLQECTDILGRMDTLVQWYSKIPQQEKNTKSLLAIRIQLMRQFKPGPDWTINDYFTVTPEYLTMAANYIKKLFQVMVTRVRQYENQPSGQQPSVSPQGVPHVYGPGSMPPQELNRPPPKKMKQSQAGNITGTTGTTSPAAKHIAADARSEALSDKRSGTPNMGPDQQHPASGSPAAQPLSGALLTSADNVEDVAAGFCMFREPLPEHATEITSIIADLYSISHSLRVSSTILEKGIHQQHIASAESDLELVCTSLKQTLDDIFDFFGDIDLRQGLDRDKYKRTWTVMCKYFYDESQVSLANRLVMYKAFLGELADISKEGFMDATLMAKLRRYIEPLQGRRTSRSALGLAPTSPTASNPYAPDSVDDDSNRDQPGSVSNHWVKTVFETNTSSTPIPEIGENSNCFGEPQDGVKTWLHDEDFEEALQLPFPGEWDTLVSFYVREIDHRVRIVCDRVSVNETHDYHCLPLNLLEIVRVGSCLQLCRRRRQGQELVLWLNLKFTTIESMVCFFGTFLALRSQDRGRPVEHIRDYELDMEDELYGGLIFAGKDLHALRIFQDGSSRAVRLQASVYHGEMENVPVWTAFITQHMKSEGWMRLMPPTLVSLRELQRVIFTFSDYSPPRTRDGENVIQFTTEADAQGFVDVIIELSKA